MEERWMQAGFGALVVAGSIALAMFLHPRWLRIARLRAPREHPWRWPHFFLAVSLFLCVAVLGSAALYPRDGSTPSALALLAVTGFCQGSVLLMLVLLVRSRPRAVAGLGLDVPPRKRDLFAAALAYGLAFPATIGLHLVWSALLGSAFEEQAIAGMLAELDGVSLAVAGVFATFVIPFFEEALFRGFLQSLLTSHAGPLRGILLSAALFAISHGSSAFLSIFGLSLILGYAMHRSQSLFVPWAIHALNNGVAMLGLFFFHPNP
jgi:membrane protease YdiL (CAAX protease family)